MLDPLAAPGSANCCSSAIGLFPVHTARPKWQNEVRHATPIAGLPELSSTNRATVGVTDTDCSVSTAFNLRLAAIGVQAPVAVNGVTNASHGFPGELLDLRKTQYSI